MTTSSPTTPYWLQAAIDALGHARESVVATGARPGTNSARIIQMEQAILIVRDAVTDLLAQAQAADAAAAQWARDAAADPTALQLRVISIPVLPDIATTQRLVAQVHQGQVLSNGTSRLTHLERVRNAAYRLGIAAGFEGDTMRLLEHVAWLSQVFATTPTTVEMLHTLGYPTRVTTLLMLLAQPGDAPAVQIDPIARIVARATAEDILVHSADFPAEVGAKARAVVATLSAAAP